MRNKVLLSAILLSFIQIAATAQSIKVNQKPGNISKEELEMASYAPDTSAAAVVLFRNIEVTVAMDTKLSFSKQTVVTERYKILKEAGKDCADYKLFIYSHDERMSGIKVSTYNLEEGKTVVSKLPKKLVFEEKYNDNLNTVSFSAQEVRVGSVVEVQFTITSSRFWDVGTIFLQGSYPVNYGSIVVDYSNYFNFNKMASGYVLFNSNVTDSRNESMVFSNGATLGVNFVTDKYTAWDVPALKREKYNYYPDQARLGVHYELRSVNIPDFLYFKDYSTTWENVDKQFVDEGFLKEFQKKLPFADEIEAAVKGLENEEEVIRKVREIVAGKIEWNKTTARFPNTDKAVREGSGDRADFCGVMGSALNRIGYKAEPVLVKSRTNGALATFHISTDSFDSVILQVTTPSGKKYYSDFASQYGYLNILPEHLLVPEARLIDLSGKGSWVSTIGSQKNSSKQQAIAAVSADGVVSGQLRISDSNQIAMKSKSAFDTFKDEEEAIESIEKNLDVEISSFDFKGYKEWGPSAVANISFTYDTQVAGDHIYVRPFLEKYHSANDFSDPERTTPIDFPFLEDIVYRMTLTIPEGYAVESLPGNVSLTCDVIDSRATAQFRQLNGNTLVVIYSYNRNVNRVLETSYNALRDYWEGLSDIYNSTIVLKKI